MTIEFAMGRSGTFRRLRSSSALETLAAARCMGAEYSRSSGAQAGRVECLVKCDLAYFTSRLKTPAGPV